MMLRCVLVIFVVAQITKGSSNIVHELILSNGRDVKFRRQISDQTETPVEDDSNLIFPGSLPDDTGVKSEDIVSDIPADGSLIVGEEQNTFPKADLNQEDENTTLRQDPIATTKMMLIRKYVKPVEETNDITDIAQGDNASIDIGNQEDENTTLHQDPIATTNTMLMRKDVMPVEETNDITDIAQGDDASIDIGINQENGNNTLGEYPSVTEVYYLGRGAIPVEEINSTDIVPVGDANVDLDINQENGNPTPIPDFTSIYYLPGPVIPIPYNWRKPEYQASVDSSSGLVVSDDLEYTTPRPVPYPEVDMYSTGLEGQEYDIPLNETIPGQETNSGNETDGLSFDKPKVYVDGNLRATGGGYEILSNPGEDTIIQVYQNKIPITLGTLGTVQIYLNRTELVNEDVDNGQIFSSTTAEANIELMNEHNETNTSLGDTNIEEESPKNDIALQVDTPLSSSKSGNALSDDIKMVETLATLSPITPTFGSSTPTPVVTKLVTTPTIPLPPGDMTLPSNPIITNVPTNKLPVKTSIPVTQTKPKVNSPIQKPSPSPIPPKTNLKPINSVKPTASGKTTSTKPTPVVKLATKTGNPVKPTTTGKTTSTKPTSVVKPSTTTGNPVKSAPKIPPKAITPVKSTPQKVTPTTGKSSTKPNPPPKTIPLKATRIIKANNSPNTTPTTQKPTGQSKPAIPTAKPSVKTNTPIQNVPVKATPTVKANTSAKTTPTIPSPTVQSTPKTQTAKVKPAVKSNNPVKSASVKAKAATTITPDTSLKTTSTLPTPTVESSPTTTVKPAVKTNTPIKSNTLKAAPTVKAKAKKVTGKNQKPM